MDYSHKLKAVMEQIKKILHDNDVTGAIVLHAISPIETGDPRHAQGFSEYYMKLESSYSAIRSVRDPDGMSVQIQSHRKHWNNDVNERNRRLSSTINMLDLLGRTMAHSSMQLLEMHEETSRIWNSEDTGPTTHTPHAPTQN